MRRVSNKRARLLRKRTAMLKSQREQAVCAGEALIPSVRCSGPLDPHEPLTRARGGSVVDSANLTWLCRRHHGYVHLHPLEAHKLGLLVHSWERGRTIDLTGRWQ